MFLAPGVRLGICPEGPIAEPVLDCRALGRLGTTARYIGRLFTARCPRATGSSVSSSSEVPNESEGGETSTAAFWASRAASPCSIVVIVSVSSDIPSFFLTEFLAVLLTLPFRFTILFGHLVCDQSRSQQGVLKEFHPTLRWRNGHVHELE